MNNEEKNPDQPQHGSGWGKKLLVLTGVAALFGVCYFFFGDYLNLEYLAQRETQLREFQNNNPILVYGLAFLIYVIVVALSLPGATIMTLLYGWYFGLVRGVLLVSFASTAGATLAFLLCRFLFRDSIQQRFGDRLTKFNEALEREGPFFLFSLRLIPAVPFFIINAVMGLTPIRTFTFWWVSQIGMLAGTAVYVYAGSSVPNLQSLADEGVGAAFSPTQLTQITIAFVLLGLFPFAARFVMGLLSGSKKASSSVKIQHADAS